MSNNVQQVPIRSVGMEPSAIAKLPMFGYKRRHDENASMECSVCLSVLEDEEVVRMLPGCRHVFHVDCVDMWLHSHSTCPVCRADVEVPVEKGETSTSEMKVVEEGSVPVLSSPFRRMLS
ncbi:hypothetical protein J5N97_025087 [Dioscorea zingiberensis]|uniref:RING-type E3 ubiquitin transferase n=1 Tax=Dioscorea zingiberensis TaxID=325984 RepID=A0A9D5C8R4_9LILI|nr:hypothetical protein J5N97_025087 [Dioscorea zingiberensis]